MAGAVGHQPDAGRMRREGGRTMGYVNTTITHPSMQAPRSGFCECEQGEWGEACPACGQRLPPLPGPLRSWHAARALDPEVSAHARASLARTQPFRGWHIVSRSSASPGFIPPAR